MEVELGGKSPNIVFADADFESAVDYALLAIYAGCGQVCSAGSRLILDDAVYDRFIARLVERANKIVVGNGFDRATEMDQSSARSTWQTSNATLRPGSPKARNSFAAANGRRA